MKGKTLRDVILLILGLASIIFGVFILWFWHPNPCDGYQICAGGMAPYFRSFVGSAFIVVGSILVIIAVIHLFRRRQHQRRNREMPQHQ